MKTEAKEESLAPTVKEESEKEKELSEKEPSVEKEEPMKVEVSMLEEDEL